MSTTNHHHLFTPQNRPNPWWSTSTARTKLLELAQPLTHDDDVDYNHINDNDKNQLDSAYYDDGYYVYSKQILIQRFTNLSNLQSVDKIFYAQKANNNPDILRLFYSLGCGIECVSLQELNFVLSLFPMINGDRLLWTPNFASKREFQTLQQLFNTTDRLNNPQITQIFPFVTIDNMYIFENWDIQTIFNKIPIFLRIAPSTDGYGHHSHVSTGLSSKFGIYHDDLITFFSSTTLGKEFALQIRGLHMHKGSGVSTSDEWSKTATTLLSHSNLFPNLTHIDIGGGLSIPYKPTDIPFNLTQLDESLLKIKQQYSNITFCIEPGRYLVAESGVLLTRINQFKSKSHFKFVGLSLGMNGLIRPALYNSYHHIINLTKYDSKYLMEHNTTHVTTNQLSNNGIDVTDNDSIIVDIVGPICETGDFLGKDRLFPVNSNEGDIVLIDCTGAYGRAMANQYNLRLLPREFLIDFD